jgi:transposase InsO family protein
MITEHQYRRLMNEYQKCGRVGRAALKASMDRKTAARYLAAEHGPQVRAPRWWRTRPDPLQAVWPEAERWLGRAPELETKALFEHLLATRPEEISARAHRSFYRRVAQWKREHGAPREVFFPQARTPGASLQLDWTHASELAVKIGGEAFSHLLCHAVLPYSNWEWAVPCRSESFLSLKAGLSAALWELGGVPTQLQTDQSSAATHAVRRAARERGFNPEYLALCAYHRIEPRTINRGSPEENGDVESANGHLKRRLEAHLVLRGGRDFAREADYGAFVAQVCRGANALRHERLAEERAVLRPLPATRYPEAEEIAVRVSSYSTVRVKNSAYSLPSQLIGAMVTAQVTESEIGFRHAGREVARYRRRRSQEPAIDYRHVIHSLVRKPGAFAGYIYREELFPRSVFRQAYDRLKQANGSRADAIYVRVLALAAESGEEPVAAALGQLLRANHVPSETSVRERLATPLTSPPALASFAPELHDYDQLLEVGT